MLAQATIGPCGVRCPATNLNMNLLDILGGPPPALDSLRDPDQGPRHVPALGSSLHNDECSAVAGEGWPERSIVHSGRLSRWPCGFGQAFLGPGGDLETAAKYLPPWLAWLRQGIQDGGFWLDHCYACGRPIAHCLQPVGWGAWSGFGYEVDEDGNFYRVETPPGGWVSALPPYPPHGRACAGRRAANEPGILDREFARIVSRLRAQEKRGAKRPIWAERQPYGCRLRTELLANDELTLTND
jgi:hypothetical protein